MKVRVLHSPYKSGRLKRYDDGGDMSSEIEGLRSINEGGSHEENPLGGVPQGYADDGGQNLVEEGEVIYDDYVYSDRLSPSLRELDSFSLPKKYGGKTFAEIAKKLSDEAEERPNDPISQSGLDSNMGRLRDLQEEHKAQKEAERQEAYERGLADAAAQFQQYGYPQRVPDEVKASMQPGLSERIATGGIDGLYQEPEEHQGAYGMHLHGGDEDGDTSSLTNGSYDWNFDNLFTNTYQDAKNQNLYIPYYQSGEQAWYTNKEKKWSELPEDEQKQWVRNNIENTREYEEFNKYVKEHWNNEDVKSYLEKLKEKTGREFKNYNEWIKARTDGVMGYVHETPNRITATAEQATEEATPEETTTPQPEESPTPEGEPEKKKEEDTKPEPYEPLPTWMQYAPIAGSALGAVNAWLSPPDHTVSNAMRGAGDLPLRLATYRTNNDYQRFMPYDTDYYKNQLAAQANANRAAAAQLGAGRGNAALLMTQANRDALKSLGTGLLQMQMANDEKRLNVAKYNHGINQENSQGLYSASAQNATLAAARDQKRAELLNQAYKRLGEENDAAIDARSAALTNLATNLGTLGTSNYTRNFYGSMPSNEEKLMYNYTVSPQGVWIRGSKKEQGAGTVDLSGAKIGAETGTKNKYGGRLSHKYCSLRPRRRK